MFLLTACSGGGDGETVLPLVTAFQPSTTARNPGLVYLVENDASDEDFVLLDVMIQGPTGDIDMYSFAFDLELSNTAVARYVPDTAEFGTALELYAGQGSSVMATQSDNRVVIGVSKTGGGAGNGVSSESAPILRSLTFQILQKGTTEIRFSGSPSNPSGPAALDSNGNVIPNVEFDPGVAKILRGSP